MLHVNILTLKKVIETDTLEIVQAKICAESRMLPKWLIINIDSDFGF